MSASGFSYDAGLAPAVVVAALVGGLSLWLWWSRGSPPLALALAAGLGSFAGAFAILNLLLQVDELGSAWLEQEARNGRLALRTASIVVAAAGIAGVYRLLRTGPDPFLLSGLEAHVSWHEREGRRLLRAFAHQAFLYTSVMGLLWVLAAEAKTSTSIVALNWLVTFVVDDWAILGHYTRHYYIRPSSRHQLQLQAVNMIIAVLLVAVLAEEYSAWAAAIGAIVVLSSFVVVPAARGAAGVWARLRDLRAGARPPAPLGAHYDEVWKRNRRLEGVLQEYRSRGLAWREAHGAAIRQRDAAQRDLWIERHPGPASDDRADAARPSGQELADAIRAGDEQRVLAALRVDPALAVARDRDGIGLVCVAAVHGTQALVAALLADAPPVDVFDAIALDDAPRLDALLVDNPLSWTLRSPQLGQPLAFAARLGHVAAVEALLGHGADPDGRLDYDPPEAHDPAEAQLWLVQGMVEGLVGGPATDDPPLIEAIRGRDPATVRALLAAGAEPNVGWLGRSPLHYAAHKGYGEIAEILIAAGADTARVDGDEHDPADTADAAGHGAVATLIRAHQDDALARLRKAGADYRRARRDRYPTP